MTAPSLEARNVSRSFGSLKAVDGVSLALQSGQVFALLGASGSGKSTLLRILAGLEGLDAGEVWASGSRVASTKSASPPETRGVGMVFQDFALFPHLTALKNVMFGLSHLSKDQRTVVAMEWLNRVGLQNRSDYYPHQLSGGEQQRVALARALAPSPTALLMDEPFSGLDPHLRADLQRTMLATLRAAGVPALIVSHDTEEALAMADQVAIMDHGRIIQAGTPGDVYNAPVSLIAARALGAIWTFEGIGNNGAIPTPFGTFATPLEGKIVMGVRPDATTIEPRTDGNFTVSDVRGVGKFLSVTAECADCVVIGRIEARLAPNLGETVHVTVSASDVFMFGA
jgi:iron(III) transport system ATP-binding protein